MLCHEGDRQSKLSGRRLIGSNPDSRGTKWLVGELWAGLDSLLPGKGFAFIALASAVLGKSPSFQLIENPSHLDYDRISVLRIFIHFSAG